MSIQARFTGNSWNPGKHLHIGASFCTKHSAFGKQVAVSQGSSQSGPTFGSGQLHAPFEQIAFPGQLSLLVQTTELVQDLVMLLKGSPFGHEH